MLSGMADERPIVFPCEGEELIGIVHHALGERFRGVLFVVGGPQYRIGSHRQFLLLARTLVERGHPCMRFDSRGMGDSSGSSPGFDDLSSDIRAAIDAFMAAVPGMTEVVLWGLCDGASAAALYAPNDDRVRGVVLVNPWVRTAVLEARAKMTGYYADRIRDRDFWVALLHGRIGMVAISSALDTALRAFRSRLVESKPSDVLGAQSLPEQILLKLKAFRGRMLFVLSGRDLTAQEFNHLCRDDERWARLMANPRVTRFELPNANHTFARGDWRESVAVATDAWLCSIGEHRP